MMMKYVHAFIDMPTRHTWVLCENSRRLSQSRKDEHNSSDQTEYEGGRINDALQPFLANRNFD